jgi:hypothetical protein
VTCLEKHQIKTQQIPFLFYISHYLYGLEQNCDLHERKEVRRKEKRKGRRRRKRRLRESYTLVFPI